MRVEDILKEFKLDLLSMDSEKIFKKYFFDSPSYLFEHVLKKPSLEDKIKRWISDATDVPASNIFLMGSSKLGFSISPTKKFSPIDAKFRHTNKTNDKSRKEKAYI